jgi:UDP-N-acetylmuramate dehydrogenase
MTRTLKVERNISLKPFNTFGIDVVAPTLLYVHDEQDLRQIIADPALQDGFILGGGSNVLFRMAPQKSIWLNRLKGREVIGETDDTVTLRVRSGENWHELVMWTLVQGYFGLENLALIPGTLGAAPIQNIGAYGVEFKDVCVGVEVIELYSGTSKFFSAQECQFGYRTSIFKEAAKHQFFITAVHLHLSKVPNLNVSYGVIAQNLLEKGVSSPTPLDVAQTVIKIRQSKLPDPAVLGNAGSFFKNPSISASIYAILKATHPNIVAYPNADGTFKLAAGWLIETCGWKGIRHGDAGCYEKQALVLVNHGQAAGDEIWALATQIMASVNHKFGVQLEPEVNIFHR